MTSLHDFEAYLTDRRLVQKKQLPFFLRWVANYLSFCEKSVSEPGNEGQVQDFLQFMGKNKEECQLKQAWEAIRLLLFRPPFQTAERNLLFLRNCRQPVAPR